MFGLKRLETRVEVLENTVVACVACKHLVYAKDAKEVERTLCATPWRARDGIRITVHYCPGCAPAWDREEVPYIGDVCRYRRVPSVPERWELVAEPERPMRVPRGGRRRAGKA